MLQRRNRRSAPADPSVPGGAFPCAPRRRRLCGRIRSPRLVHRGLRKSGHVQGLVDLLAIDGRNPLARDVCVLDDV